ncbi:uncharacterized protein NPIL_318421, partial [Nephila pilipes]
MEKNQNSKYVLDTPTTFDIKKLQKDDIVWAEFRHVYWPAILRRVYKSSKKVSIWYCDSPGTSFKLQFNRIRSFRDMEFRKKAEDQQMSPEMSQLFTKVFDLARTYDKRRVDGVHDDPASYFDSTKPHFTVSYEDPIKSGTLSQQESENKENNKSAQASRSEIPSNKENVASCSYETNRDEESSDCGEDSNFVDAESVLDSEKERRNAKYQSYLNGCCDEETADAIVSYIKSGMLDEYLKDIYRGKIKSKNQNLFNYYLKERKVDILWYCFSNVHIAKHYKERDICDYLFALYDRTVLRKEERSRYVFAVWLHEAMDKAYSLIKGEPS